ncbi:hypothetical protein IKG54_01615 [Candidatus Saccharibacteria bacterium]|nr:hypothetical protein [Candidatus Saccharibacteria bacterium]
MRLKHPITYLVIAALFALAPLISNNYFDDSHDTPFHIQSVIGLEQGSDNIFEIFNAKTFEYISYDYGYGEGVFYPQLPHQIAATILHFGKHFGMDVLDALKVTNFLGLALSGIFMYLLMVRIAKNKVAAFLSALFYMTAPYHLGDIFIRDAFNESFFFTFIPLAILSLHELLSDNYRTFFICFVVGFVGLINTHLVMTVFFILFLVAASLISFKQLFTWQRLRCLILATIIVSVIVLPFIIPMIENKQNYQYAVFADSYMYTMEKINASRVSLMRFIVPNDNTNVIPYNFNLLLLVLVSLSILNYRRLINKQSRFLIIFATVSGMLSIIMMSDFISWEHYPSILRNIQFPWRLEIFTIFGASALAGLALNHYKAYLNTSLIMLCVLSCVASILFVQARQDYRTYDISSVKYEYADYYPAQLLDAPEYLPNRPHEVMITSGDATISNYIDNGNDGLSFDINNVDGDITIEIPRLYYLGYRVAVNDSSDVDYSVSPNGLVSISLGQDAHVSVKYVGTASSNIATAFSILTLFSFVSWVSFSSIRKSKKVV